MVVVVSGVQNPTSVKTEIDLASAGGTPVAAPLIEFSKVVDVAQSAAAGTQNALNRN